ncbi:LPXTG cell wall anchor domain-containing protein [Bacillus sp. 1P02SD]|uniref:LPXTG cell wall anchor domain-containing protein n=1 Tax=Bacillus sp. 1P02SD TaxID=3132264 RepID=UPI0039A21B5C
MKEPVTFEELMAKDKITPDVVIKISEPDCEMLADIILSAKESAKETPVDEKPTEHSSNDQPSQAGSEDSVGVVRDEETTVKLQNNAYISKTVDGAKLPNTASKMPINILLGFVMMLVGALIFIRTTKKSISSHLK